MRIRTQKNNVLLPPKYEKGISSVLVYDDSDKIIFAVTQTIPGVYKYTHVGQPEFETEVRRITGLSVDKVVLKDLNADGSST